MRGISFSQFLKARIKSESFNKPICDAFKVIIDVSNSNISMNSSHYQEYQKNIINRKIEQIQNDFEPSDASFALTYLISQSKQNYITENIKDNSITPQFSHDDVQSKPSAQSLI